MKPKTLEEAIALLEQVSQQVTDLQSKNKILEDKNKQVIQEKKDVLELFSKEDKEGMTDNERKLAVALEAEQKTRTDLEKKIAADNEHRNREQNERTTKMIEERITKISKGDTAIADKLRANVSLLEKLPRQTDSEVDTLLGSAYNMLGTKEPNPLNAPITGGNTNVDQKQGFGETTEGKSVAGKLGLTHVAGTAKVEEKSN